ncbi:MAG: hypothetical protein KAT68_02875 [Bacteroidales bacterium]|nr:hypothetical protein [Bacteroidales bacterium]
MSLIKQILQSEKKPKEKVVLLVENVKKEKTLFGELMEILKTGSDVEKGTVAEVMKHVTKEKPKIAIPYINEMIEYINYKAPRVKWGIPESIGNMAQKFPKEVEKAVPKLFLNTKDKSTVVRWCAAFALSEIAINNSKLQKELIPKFVIMVKKEQNNGVKNVYLKAIKILEKK